MASSKKIEETETEMSTLYPSSSKQRLIVVARKYIRKMGLKVQESDIENELRALQKLCAVDQGNFLVRVFNHERSASREFVPADLDCCSIDMELCSRNLKDEIAGQESTLQGLLEVMASTEDKSEMEGICSQLSSKNKHIVDILHQVLDGLEFIHSMDEVHRDLKPENGLNYRRRG
jgi:serine/threonine protein kinase